MWAEAAFDVGAEEVRVPRPLVCARVKYFFRTYLSIRGVDMYAQPPAVHGDANQMSAALCVNAS